MIILTNGLCCKTDEGALKVASSLTKKIKKLAPETTVITYGDECERGDIHLSLNKLLLDRKLFSIIKEMQEPLLYIPMPAETISTALRLLVLSLAAKKGLSVVISMSFPANPIEKFLLRLSGATIMTLSNEAYETYREIVGDKAVHLRCGVDTEKFIPADEKTKAQLRKKYKIEPGKKVVTHVGHLKEGRNIREMLKLGDEYHAVLVVSSQTESEWDMNLKADLENRPYTNIIIGKYLKNIEEIYQMSDAYFFPVVQSHNCIDVPLSAMEAAACGVPVVATEYGELKEMVGKSGFWFIDSFEPERLNELVQTAVEQKGDPRVSVLDYDWKNAANSLISGKLMQRRENDGKK